MSQRNTYSNSFERHIQRDDKGALKWVRVAIDSDAVGESLVMCAMCACVVFCVGLVGCVECAGDVFATTWILDTNAVDVAGEACKSTGARIKARRDMKK